MIRAHTFWRGLAGPLAALCFASLGVFGVVVGYARLVGALLPELDDAVGEVVMNQAIRLESAGFAQEAEAQYRKALQGEFAGPQNRAHSLKHLGELLLEDGRPEESLPYLEECAESEAVLLTVYEQLCKAYFQLDRLEQAESTLSTWKAAADAALHPREQALSRYFAGRLALARGNKEEALRQFIKGSGFMPGKGNEGEAARLLASEGRDAEALQYVELDILSGATGEAARQARALARDLRARLNRSR